MKQYLAGRRAAIQPVCQHEHGIGCAEQTKVTVEAAARLQGELIASRAQLEGLKQTYTPENIRVKVYRPM